MTYLARIMSDQRRELERVVAVTLSPDGTATFSDELDTWMRFADRDKAISATDVWEKHFAHWDGLDEAVQVAGDGFAAEAETTITLLRETIERERAELDCWLEDRAVELTPAAAPTAQADLFTTDAEEQPAPVPTTPLERLAAIRADQARPDRTRSSADAVLKMYRARLDRLERRSNIGEPEIVPLGMLMVIPEVDHGA